MANRKPKYGYNAKSKEVHLLANEQPQCNLPDDLQRFTSLKALKEATKQERPDHCAWCWRMEMKSEKETE